MDMNNMLEYNGYHAKIEYSAEDDLFIGDVFGIKDTIAFVGSSVEELKSSFKSCMDEYIEWCQELGVEPDKEFKGSFNVRVTPERHRTAALNAMMKGVSLNHYVSSALESYINYKELTISNLVMVLPQKYISANLTSNISDSFIFNKQKELPEKELIYV